MAKHGTVMLGIRGELWGAYIDLLATAAFRYPRDRSQCIHHNVLSTVFPFREYQCYGTERWEGSQRVSKALIQAKASGIHRHRGILTTVRSSFSGDDTSTSSSSPCQFLAPLKHRAFVWSITVDLLLFFCVWTGSHPSLCSLFLFGQDAALQFDIEPSGVLIFILFKGWGFFFFFQQWKHKKCTKSTAIAINTMCWK